MRERGGVRVVLSKECELVVQQIYASVYIAISHGVTAQVSSLAPAEAMKARCR